MITRKTPDQIAVMRDAGRILAQTLKLVGAMVAPGTTTRDLDKEAEQFILSRGGKPTFKGYGGFPATLCTSVNDEIVHGIPSKQRILRAGDIISIDCGVTYKGFIADAAVTLPVGEITEDLKQLISVTRDSLLEAISNARPGVKLGTLSNSVEAFVQPHGYGVVREYCGHGVGQALHEDPQVPNFGRKGTGPSLQEGWTLAIEPMVNLGTHATRTLKDGWTVVTADGRHSAHFEHTVAVTKDGPVILTLP